MSFSFHSPFRFFTRIAILTEEDFFLEHETAC
ncbi:hypothetical protein ELI_4375 [Eubacterium callanderi]|uniref:Uncharacterized protein n=1 Tax=Eubacterium callanderi TaxID=53442 RepID=E3GQM2_9FIRM|nr:hypothetical protein ELI_4375 [Eubacterium callanderi]